LRYALTNGAEGMPLGVFIAFTGYLWMFWAPVQHLGMMSRTINRVSTSASRVFEVLDTVPSIVNKPEAKSIEPLQGHVVFENVTFTYDGVRNVLKGVSFEVKPGEMIGLVGPSGGGKTTLVNLICRFYDVKDGSVKIDGVDVRDLELASMRRQIGVVLQEPYLFHGTIAENIAYGSHNADLKDIITAAKAANAHEFICGFPDGYETIVGERGQTLSGGERQRISIARAILHNPRILILDEATSSVDTETEKKIQEALQRLVAGRTTFAIAHRLSTLSIADRLFVMEDGKLVEQGTHEELLAKPDGVYAKLHHTQAELHALIAV
jgi:ATP-binding cassette subfamily B protein